MKCLIAYAILLIHGVSGDPCNDYTPLTNLNSRYLNYKLNPNDPVVVDDAWLSNGWYFAQDILMYNQAPGGIYYCGTKFPVWLDGTFPQSDNEEVDGIACIRTATEECAQQFTIKIRKCPNDYFVYWLVATPTVNSGYCFGEGQEGEAPSSAPLIGQVTTILATETSTSGDIYTRVNFVCNFHLTSTQDLYYRVTWYQDGEPKYISDFANNDNLILLYLDEDLFVSNKFSLGNLISCDVQSFYTKHGPPSPRSERSTGFFAGLNILTPMLAFTCDDTDQNNRRIRLRPTVPIGCVGTAECEIRLQVTIPDDTPEGQCTGIGINGARCSVPISSVDATTTDVEIFVASPDNGQYVQSETFYQVYLKIAPTHENLIWNNYQLDPISVNILPPNAVSSQIYGKKCHSNNDPHMVTFDNRHYELQRNYVGGVYTLYYHPRFESEVQIMVAPCNPNAFCNCGVAVRMGQDVYVIDVCGAEWIFAYLACGDKAIRVQSFKERLYKIMLPYGTYVEAEIQQCCGGTFLSVRVLASLPDWNGESVGLCGTADNNSANDFVDKNGNILSEGVLIDYWRVKNTAENMFSGDFSINSLTHTAFTVCLCSQTSSNPLAIVSCDNNPVAACSNGKDTSRDNCPDVIRTRRSVDGVSKLPLVDVSKSPFITRRKRQANEPADWTEANATQICTEYLESSELYTLCATVPNVRPEFSLEDCVKDILLSNGLEWMPVAKENMQSTCTSELTKNISLWMPSNANSLSIAQQIQQIACTNDCSDQGTCDNGVCVCDADFGGADCSMQADEPITAYGLPNDGVCDQHYLPCTNAYLFGFPILDSPNLTCRLREFTIFPNGTRQYLDIHTVSGQFSTIVEVVCPLESLTPSDPNNFAYGYSVSVSNGGKIFSNEYDLLIYDSSCQELFLDDPYRMIALKDGFCFIEGSCYADGDVDVNDNCSVCISVISSWSWSWQWQPGCNGSISIIHGDPHIDTFDGRRYRYRGVGSHYLMFGGNVYSIIGNFIRPGERRVSFLESVTIKYKDNTYVLEEDLELKVDGIIKQLPYNDWPDIAVFWTPPKHMTAMLENVGISVRWDGKNTAEIVVSGTFFGNTKGLCGTFNHNPTDDFTTMQGTVVKRAMKFGMSWKLPQ